jgi:ribosomal protein S13
VQDLLKTPMEEILEIQGIGEKTAEKLIEEAKELEARRGRELAEEAARAAEEARIASAVEPGLEAPGETPGPAEDSPGAEEETPGDTKEETRGDAS